MRNCGICKQQFPATLEFFHKKRNGLQPICKTCDKQKNKAWADKNKESIIKRNAKWRSENKEKVKQTRAKYLKANPGIIAEHNHLRRAKIAGNGYEFYTEKQVLDTYGTNCYLCDMPININGPRRIGVPGWRSGLHIEHFMAIANGGSDTLENVRPSHGWCNLTKGRM